MGENVSEGTDLMDADPEEEQVVAVSSSSAASTATVGRLFDVAGVMFKGWGRPLVAGLVPAIPEGEDERWLSAGGGGVILTAGDDTVRWLPLAVELPLPPRRQFAT